MNKTRFEWLMELPDHIRNNIPWEKIETNSVEIQAGSLRESIESLFDIQDTPENKDYWDGVILNHGKC